jgi:hypothetical protein
MVSVPCTSRSPKMGSGASGFFSMQEASRKTNANIEQGTLNIEYRREVKNED